MLERETNKSDLEAAVGDVIQQLAADVTLRAGAISLPHLDELGAEDVVVACEGHFRLVIVDHRTDFDSEDGKIFPSRVFARVAEDGAAWLDYPDLRVRVTARAEQSDETGQLKMSDHSWVTEIPKDKMFIAADSDESLSLESIVEGLDLPPIPVPM